MPVLLAPTTVTDGTLLLATSDAPTGDATHSNYSR